jgi:ArsR family transcriptional regulator
MTKQEIAGLTAKTKVLKALAHPARLWMVEQLEGGERCVCELVEGLGLDFSTVSKHLLVLKNAAVVADDKRGKQVAHAALASLQLLNHPQPGRMRQRLEHLCFSR